MLKIQNRCFGHLNFCYWDLSFDLVQDGELTEPFRASCLGFWISVLGIAQNIMGVNPLGMEH